MASGFEKTDFPGLLVYTPKVFSDPRGYFFESFNGKSFLAGGVGVNFVQDNQAFSSYGVVRGLHFQKSPYAQTKLIRALAGEILDVVVDIRMGSPTFGKSFSILLSAENKQQLLIPKGFAHGYSVVSDTAEVFYKCDAFYYKESEGGIAWDDMALAIDWRIPRGEEIISEKDLCYPNLAESEVNFTFQDE